MVKSDFSTSDPITAQFLMVTSTVQSSTPLDMPLVNSRVLGSMIIGANESGTIRGEGTRL
jgi:hypothetical protein